jgi:putative transcriptional regulator
VIDKETSKIIRKLRSDLGLTQEQFATKIGVTYTTVNRWENNKAKPSPLALKQIKELHEKNKEK